METPVEVKKVIVLPNGLRQEYTSVDGQIEGTKTVYDDRRGSRIVKSVEYKAGRKHGPYVKWFTVPGFEDQIQCEWSFEDDRLDGLCRSFELVDGKVRPISELHYKQGRLNGPCVRHRYKNTDSRGDGDHAWYGVELKEEANYVDDVVEGPVIRTDQMSSGRSIVEMYSIRNMKREGQYVKISTDDQAIAEGTYVDGELEGLYTHYDTGDQWYWKHNYRRGKEHGWCTVYYPSGNLVRETLWSEGKRNGPQRCWHEDGTLDTYAEYKDNELIKYHVLCDAEGVNQVLPDGEITVYAKAQTPVEDKKKQVPVCVVLQVASHFRRNTWRRGYQYGESIYSDVENGVVMDIFDEDGAHYPVACTDGTIFEVGKLVNRDGAGTPILVRKTARQCSPEHCDVTRRDERDPSTPTIKTHEFFRRVDNGRKHGPCRKWGPDGTVLISESHYRDGHLHGLSREWTPDGKLILESTHRDGRLDGSRREWGADGTLTSETHHLDGRLNGSCRKWRPDGTLMSETHYRNDSLDGVSRGWSPDGKLIHHTDHAGGRLTKVHVLCDPDGVDHVLPPGDITVYKACRTEVDGKEHDVYVQLRVQAQFKRVTTLERYKSRVENAQVADIYDREGNHYQVAHSFVYTAKKTLYELGRLVNPDGFDPDPHVDCGQGISVHLTERMCDQWFRS